MAKRLSIILLTGMLAAGLFAAAPSKESGKRKPVNLPLRGGSNDPEIRSLPVFPPYPSHHLDDYIGTIDTAGTTWYDYQHNGTCGRMIDVDNSGRISMVWMNGLTSSISGPRYVYYNVWNPTTSDFIHGDTGIRIAASSREGYISQTTTADGFCFPAFHQQTTNENFHSAAAIDYCAYCEAFTTFEPAWCYDGGYDIELCWPKIDMDVNGTLHMMAEENNSYGETIGQIYYSRGTPLYDSSGHGLDIRWDDMGCGGFELIDTVMVIAYNVSCSRHTERCVIAWCHSLDDIQNDPSQINNDLYIQISEDGGLNWGERINVTQWTPPVYPSENDTLRCYADVSILFDEADNIHLAFTTTAFWWYDDSVPQPILTDYRYSMIYHWNEETGYYSLVADGWYEGYQPGAWQRNVQRPSLAIDTTTGYLYCSYQWHDTTTCSPSGFPMADAIVTVSVNNGTHWAIGTNVTNTTPDSVPAGGSMHERDITVAPLVTGGFLHMEYVLDKDAGGIPQEEGVPTLNPVIYQRIPANQIAIWPLVRNYPMHYDSTGHPPDASTPVVSDKLPERFVLHQNYPNPFNPLTTIQFDLIRRTKATLKIYNILGQEVFTLFNNDPLSPGVHQINFDGSNLPSGIYIYRLETPDFSSSRKMVLLK